MQRDLIYRNTRGKRSHFPLCRLGSTLPESPATIKPALDPALRLSTRSATETSGFVYLHCHFNNEWKDALLRIWKTSYLIDRSHGVRSVLEHAENISIAPLWMLIPDHRTHRFLLIFSPLPKTCTRFDFVEEIAQPGGFFVQGIPRNNLDVYHIEV